MWLIVIAFLIIKPSIQSHLTPWKSHIDTQYPAMQGASSSSANIQPYSQTTLSCQLQHSYLFIYLSGFPVYLLRCRVLWALLSEARLTRLGQNWLCHVALMLGYLSWGLIMMPLSRSLRRLCSVGHLRSFMRREAWQGPHFKCCNGALDAQARMWGVFMWYRLHSAVVAHYLCWMIVLLLA